MSNLLFVVCFVVVVVVVVVEVEFECPDSSHPSKLAFVPSIFFPSHNHYSTCFLSRDCAVGNSGGSEIGERTGVAYTLRVVLYSREV